MKPRTKWTLELVESELKMVIDGIGRFPSNQDLRSLGRNDLSSQIVARGGFSCWQNHFKMTPTKSDSLFGWNGEVALSDKLIGLGYCVETVKGVRAPFDLIVNDCVRIDVKTAKYAEYGPCKGWFYRVAKCPSADLMALYQFDTGDVYFIPWHICPRTNITISRGGGIYSRYLNDFTWIDRFQQAFKDCTNNFPTM